MMFCSAFGQVRQCYIQVRVKHASSAGQVQVEFGTSSR